MIPSIRWEKYEHPLLKDTTEHDYVDEESKEYYDDEETDDNIIEDPTSYINTPWGLIPRPNIMLEDNWNLWVGHTNFIITKALANLIENTPGVELLEIFSPYRFRISIAKHPDFKTSFVLAEIAKNTCNTPIPTEIELETQIQSTIEKHKEKILKTGNPHWFIFVFPNGKVVSKNSAEENEKYLSALSIVHDLKDRIDGTLITNKD